MHSVTEQEDESLKFSDFLLWTWKGRFRGHTQLQGPWCPWWQSCPGSSPSSRPHPKWKKINESQQEHGSITRIHFLEESEFLSHGA